MSVAGTILVVAPEGVLRRSIVFSLEVEGFVLEAHETLEGVVRCPSATGAVCAVIDESAMFATDDMHVALQRITVPVIVLTGGVPRPDLRTDARFLSKPLRGPDLVDMVLEIRAAQARSR